MSISIFSFALGILAVMALVEAIVLIVGFVKVIRMEKGLVELNSAVVYNIDNVERIIQRRSDDLWLETEKIRSYVDSRIDKRKQ